jgi:hypothetical protein
MIAITYLRRSSLVRGTEDLVTDSLPSLSVRPHLVVPNASSLIRDANDLYGHAIIDNHCYYLVTVDLREPRPAPTTPVGTPYFPQRASCRIHHC